MRGTMNGSSTIAAITAPAAVRSTMRHSALPQRGDPDDHAVREAAEDDVVHAAQVREREQGREPDRPNATGTSGHVERVGDQQRCGERPEQREQTELHVERDRRRGDERDRGDHVHERDAAISAPRERARPEHVQHRPGEHREIDRQYRTDDEVEQPRHVRRQVPVEESQIEPERPDHVADVERARGARAR